MGQAEYHDYLVGPKLRGYGKCAGIPNGKIRGIPKAMITSNLLEKPLSL